MTIAKFRISLFLIAMAWTVSHASAAEYTYFWAERPTAASYSPKADYAATGSERVTITRRAVGHYRVNFNRVLAGVRSYNVTRYGEGHGYCNLHLPRQIMTGRPRTEMDVYCFNGNDQPRDSKFSFLSVRPGPGDESGVAFGFIYQLENPPRLPSPFVLMNFPDPMTVIKRGIGGYTARFTGSPNIGPGTGIVTSYFDMGYCNDEGNGFQSYAIKCFNASGPAESWSYFLRLEPRIPNHSGVTILGQWRGPFTPDDMAVNPIHSYASDGSAQSLSYIRTGQYAVKIGPEASIGGNVHISPTRSDATCSIASWGGGTAKIRCFKGTTPVDSYFSLLAVKRPPTLAERTGVEVDINPRGVAGEEFRLQGQQPGFPPLVPQENVPSPDDQGQKKKTD